MSHQGQHATEKYEPIIAELNQGIREFNASLQKEHHFQLISTANPDTFTAALAEPWGQQGWPSKDTPGVYMFCCRNEPDDDQLGLYIGKASLQNMGHRIYAHLNPHRASGIYRFQNWIIEAILATPANNPDVYPSVAALEQFLCGRGYSSATILNSVGVRRSSAG